MIATLKAKENLKQKNIYLAFSFVFLALGVISILCFIFLSNFKVQLLMSILGSIVSSILIVLFIGFLTLGYFPQKSLSSFYVDLENKEEQIVKGKISLLNKSFTLKKNLSFFVVFINEKEYLLINEKLYKSLNDGNEYEFVVLDNYIAGLNKNEEVIQG